MLVSAYEAWRYSCVPRLVVGGGGARFYDGALGGQSLVFL